MKFYKKTSSNKETKDMSLTQLANLYETDKGDADYTKLSWHRSFPNHRTMAYTSIYEKYMNNKRDSEVTLFEVGIRDQRFPYASVKMWTRYFENLNLYCLDNFWGEDLYSKEHEINYINSIGANFIYADQNSVQDWLEIKKIVDKIDFFVEDGSHWSNHMMRTLYESCDMLKPGGYYFMEDIQNPLKSKGWYGYDNTDVCEELKKFEKTSKFNTSYLSEEENEKINDSFLLKELILDKHDINYLAVLQKKQT